MDSAGPQEPDEMGKHRLLRHPRGLVLRIRDHLQRRDERLPLEWLVGRHCDPAAWKLLARLPEYYPKEAQEAEVSVSSAAPNSCRH